MMKKIFLFITLVCAIAYPQQQEFKKTATSGFVFLELPVSARQAALGETAITFSDLNAEGVFINPASLGFSKIEHSFSSSYSPWIADTKHLNASYVFKSDAGAFGVGFIMMDYGDFTHTVVPSNSSEGLYQVLGNYSADAMAFGASYSKQLTDKFSFGVTLKYVREKIHIYTADNYLFDGGVLYYTGLGSLRIAATMQNFGVDAQFINDRFRMPTMLKLGASYDVLEDDGNGNRITVLAEAVHPNDNNERVNTGVEAVFYNWVSLRGGYKFFYDEESYSVGIGVTPPTPLPVNLDFSYSDYGRLGDIMRFTIQLGF